MDAEPVNDPGAKGEKSESNSLRWRADFESIRRPSERELVAGLWRIIPCYLVVMIGSLILGTGVSGLGKFFMVCLVSVAFVAAIPTVLLIGLQFGSAVIHGSVLNYFCPRCGKHIASNILWRCGYCDAENVGERRVYSFLFQCERCGASPKSYRCHHCRKLIFLDEAIALAGKDEHAACKWEDPVPSKEEPVEELRQQHEREAQENRAATDKARSARERLKAEFALQMEKIETDRVLKQANNPKTPLDATVEALRRAADRKLGALKAKTILEAEAAVRLKNDRDGLAKELEAIKSAYEECLYRETP